MIIRNIILSLCLFFVACSNGPEVAEVEVATMSVSYIYNDDSVMTYINNADEKQKEMADWYAVKGEKLEKENLKKAIWNFKRSITILPKYETYQKLGDLLMKDKQYRDASTLYSFLAFKSDRWVNGQWEGYYVFKSPDEEMMNNCMVAEMLAYNNISSEYIYNAVQDGFPIEQLKKNLFSDSRVTFDTASNEYKTLMLQFLSEEELTKYAENPTHFQQFINDVKDHASSFLVDKNNVANFTYNRSADVEWGMGVSLEYVQSAFLKEKREHPDEWYAYTCYHSTRVHDSLWVLHYAIDTSAQACPKIMRHIYHQLLVFDASGKILDSKVVAAQAGEYLAEMTFDKGMVTVSEWKRNWKKPYDKYDFENELISTDAIGKHQYEISGEGEFIETTRAL